MKDSDVTGRLVDRRDHDPSIGYLVCAELVLIPCFCTICRSAQVHGHKRHSTQDALVEYLTWRRSDPGNCKIQNALGSIVGADEVFEPPLRWKCVLLEAGQMSVALVLLEICNEIE
jgi:hypothetical protein